MAGSGTRGAAVDSGVAAKEVEREESEADTDLRHQHMECSWGQEAHSKAALRRIQHC